jgi:hypothetical protein
MAAFTLLQAQTQLDAWLAADAAVAIGQSYEIAGRRLVRANAAEITAKIDYWATKVTALTDSAAGRTRSRSMSVSF